MILPVSAIYKASLVAFIFLSGLTCILHISYRYSRIRRYLEMENDWRFFEKVEPRDNNIFFVKSCGSGVELTGRETCVVRAASRTNPKSKIHVMFTCPKDDETVSWKTDNVEYTRLNVDELLVDSPMDEWYRNRDWSETNSTEIIKALLLLNYGGIYLDWDYVLTRSLEGLKNFVLVNEENNSLVDQSVVALGKEKVIEKLAWNYPNELQSLWKLSVSREESVRAFSKVLKSFCGVNEISMIKQNDCFGFELMPSRQFYSDHYSQDSSRKEGYAVKIGDEIPDNELLHRYCPESGENT